MRIVCQEDSAYVLNISKGEEIISSLEDFCRKHAIRAGIVSIIGAVNELELWWYNPQRKQYHKKKFFHQLEIASLTGNIGIFQDDVIIHSHGVFSDEESHSFAGHVYRGVVSGACEVYLRVLQGPIERAYDEETGLNLIR